MELTLREKVLVGIFATFVVGLAAASAITGSSALYVAALILMMPCSIVLLLMVMPIAGLTLYLTDPLRAAGYEGTADTLADVLTGAAVWTLLAGMAVGQGLTLVLGWRGARNLFVRSRDRYCRHARPAQL